MWRGWFSKPLKPGTAAPEFALPDETGRVVQLSELRGRSVVLIFYPGDETPGCRAQLCEFRDKWAAAESEGVLVFGVNPQSAASHARFRRRHRFPFPLLVDRGQEAARRYHADGPIVRRTVYVIGPDGRIRYARRGRPAVEEVLAAARAV
jgi:peroxiredoxin Q/BCP